VKKRKLLLAVLALIIGAASAAGSRVPVGPDHQGERAMLLLTNKGGS
jgi:hypothetical protein